MRMGFGKKKIDMDEMTDLLEQLSQLVERKSNEINASITDLNKSMEDVKSSLGNWHLQNWRCCSNAILRYLLLSLYHSYRRTCV